MRAPAVAGTFYPADPGDLRDLADGLFEAAARLPPMVESGPPAPLAAGEADRRPSPGLPLAILVPHAGLVYSGVPAAAAWACLRTWAPAPGHPPPVVVMLGTNHRAGWLDGVGAWEAGSWVTPGAELVVDEDLAARIVALGPPFGVDRDAHREEHSIEVQLPLLARASPAARIVPLAVSVGTGRAAIDAGTRLGGLLAGRRAAGTPVVLAISTDMAHYPPARACERATEILLPAIVGLDPVRLAALERELREAGVRGLACGMCGIEPAVVGLAAIRAMGAGPGTPLAAATSADAGGPPDSTVGYLAVRFDPVGGAPVS